MDTLICSSCGATTVVQTSEVAIKEIPCLDHPTLSETTQQPDYQVQIKRRNEIETVSPRACGLPALDEDVMAALTVGYRWVACAVVQDTDGKQAMLAPVLPVGNPRERNSPRLGW